MSSEWGQSTGKFASESCPTILNFECLDLYAEINVVLFAIKLVWRQGVHYSLAVIVCCEGFLVTFALRVGDDHPPASQHEFQHQIENSR